MDNIGSRGIYRKIGKKTSNRDQGIIADCLSSIFWGGDDGRFFTSKIIGNLLDDLNVIMATFSASGSPLCHQPP
jgi:hypothetical protein